MSLPIDGSSDSDLRIKGLLDAQIGNWQSNSENVIMNIDNQEVEDSEEENVEWEYDHRDR